MPKVGITTRLAIAFFSVALLAAAANFMVDSVVSVVERRQIKREPPSMPQVMKQPVPTAAPQKINVPTLLAPSSEAATLSLVRYEQAVMARVAAMTPESITQLKTATSAFETSAIQYAQVVKQFNGKSLTSTIKNYQIGGAELVRTADARRKLLKQYLVRFEAMNARVKTSLDGAWKIFGRVVARQSLVQLSANLDDVRRDFAEKSTAAIDDRPSNTLLASEAKLADTLSKNAKRLESSEGKEWYAAMQDDFANLGRTHAVLTDTDRQQRLVATRFSQDTAKLQQLLITEIVTAPSALTSPSIVNTTATTIVAAEVPLANTPSPSIEAKVATTTRNGEHPVVIAWISIGVLLILLLISVSTVASILRPVRRMLSALASIARGNHGTRVPRGGIKELDLLAASINDMAEKLAAAQHAVNEHQEHLEHKVIERTRQLQHLAEHDPLTGLPNRRQLFRALTIAIDQARQAGRYVAVFFLDIDNFKNINDGLGHAVGDEILVNMAQRLAEIARPYGFAARLGGDEFTVVFESAACLDEIHKASHELVHAFHAPLALGDGGVIVSVSAGVGVYPDHGLEPDAVLRAADTALFRAKALGRSQVALFTPELLVTASAKFATEQGLRRALERGEFELVFQPEIAVNSLETRLVEALIRWRLPDGTLASPADFLPVAEESGLILEISDWVLQTAIEAASRWHHGAWPDALVAINVSARQLFDPAFVDRVQELLRAFRLPARCIEIELTENMLQTGSATIDTLRRLRAHGIAIALDDFGTGYSSLTSLEQLPLTRIKLDRSLISSIDSNPRTAAIVHATISLCHNLGLEITAEGIERPEQLLELIDTDGMYLQGYLLSKPVSADQLFPVMANIQAQLQSLLLATPRPAKRVKADNVLPFAARHTST